MADVGAVRGEKGPEGNEPKKKKPTSAEFQEMMKVGKTREVDPEEKRKRKRPEESQEDAKAMNRANLSKQKPTQKKGKKEVTPYESVGGTQPPINLSAPPPTPLTTTKAPTTLSTVSVPTPPTVQSYAAEEPTSLPQAPTPPAPPTQPPQVQLPTPTFVQKDVEEPSDDQDSEPVDEETTTSPTSSQTEQTPIQGKAKSSPTTAPKKGAEETEVLLPPLEIAPEMTEDSTVANILKGEPLEIGEIPSEEKTEGEEGVGGVSIDLPEGAWEALKPLTKEEKIEKSGERAAAGVEGLPFTPQVPTDIPQAITPTAPVAVTPFANLHPQVMQVFERMVGVMTVMNATGITQTTLNLNNPQFANSPFFGAQIVISEFTTAPKQFNIELLGNRQSADLFTKNAADLVAAFQAGNYNFKVNRIEVSLLAETSEVKRKTAQKVKRKKGGET